jgi:hypothetical protein
MAQVVKFIIAFESRGRGSFGNFIRPEVLAALMICIAQCDFLRWRRNILLLFILTAV